MKIVQSTWFSSYDNVQGRWLSEKFALFGVALSYHLLRKHYPKVVLYTNAAGYHVLIEQLGLAYDEVSLGLESPPDEARTGISFRDYWVLNKLYVYSQQQTPFVHVDNDVFMFRPLDEALRAAPLIAQNEEVGLPYYSDSLARVQRHFTYLPGFVGRTGPPGSAVNAGIVGGTAYGVYQELYAEVLAFLQQNAGYLHHVDANYFNIFLEQYLLKQYADVSRHPFTYLLKRLIRPGDRYEVSRLHEAPDLSPYVHVMDYKQNPTTCEAVAKTLYCENRDLYETCVRVARSMTAASSYAVDGLGRASDAGHPLRHLFPRTARIAGQAAGRPLDFSGERSLLHSVDSAVRDLPPAEGSVLADVFLFEYQRYRFAGSLDALAGENIYARLLESRQRAWCDGLPACRLVLSPYTQVIHSKWSWVQQNEFTPLHDARRIEDNVGQAPAQFTTLIYYYPEGQKLKEQELDAVNRYIMQGVGEEKKVAELLSGFREAWGTGSGFHPDRLLASRIRYLIYQGALCISPEAAPGSPIANDQFLITD